MQDKAADKCHVEFSIRQTDILSVRKGMPIWFERLPSGSSRNGLVHRGQSLDYWYNHKLKWDPELSVHRKACLAFSVFEVINDAEALWENDMSIIIGSHRREKPFQILVFEATQVIWVRAIARVGIERRKIRKIFFFLKKKKNQSISRGADLGTLGVRWVRERDKQNVCSRGQLS